MHAAEGIITARGGMTSHAAVVARGWGKPCVCGCEALEVRAALTGCPACLAACLPALTGHLCIVCSVIVSVWCAPASVPTTHQLTCPLCLPTLPG
jgi:hypothetical protein